MGRLASVIAKNILQGQRIVVVRCESICISGNFYRNKLKVLEFLRKRMNTKPSRGPYHFRAPSKIFCRTVRGILPHKLSRGKEALDRMKVFEGIPSPYDKKKRMVVPSCLKVLRLKKERHFCRLGELSTHVGWKQDDLIKRLEDQRKVKSEAFWKKKNALKKEMDEKKAAVSLTAEEKDILEDQRKVKSEAFWKKKNA